MPKPEKIAAVAEMKTLFEESSSFFVTDYQGLNVDDVTVLRRNLRGTNVRYMVAKNTLLRLAASEAGVEGIHEFLSGPTAVAFTSDDPVAAAKVISESIKAHELPRVKVFVVDNTHYAPEDLKRFSDLPSREQLLSNVVAAVEAPISELIGSIDGFFRKLVGLVDALAEERKADA